MHRTLYSDASFEEIREAFFTVSLVGSASVIEKCQTLLNMVMSEMMGKFRSDDQSHDSITWGTGLSELRMDMRSDLGLSETPQYRRCWHCHSGSPRLTKLEPAAVPAGCRQTSDQ